jgi:hypothetical protein
MDVPDTAVASGAARLMCSDCWLNHSHAAPSRPFRGENVRHSHANRPAGSGWIGFNLAWGTPTSQAHGAQRRTGGGKVMVCHSEGDLAGSIHSLVTWALRWSGNAIER